MNVTDYFQGNNNTLYYVRKQVQYSFFLIKAKISRNQKPCKKQKLHGE